MNKDSLTPSHPAQQDEMPCPSCGLMRSQRMAYKDGCPMNYPEHGCPWRDKPACKQDEMPSKTHDDFIKEAVALWRQGKIAEAYLAQENAYVIATTALQQAESRLAAIQNDLKQECADHVETAQLAKEEIAALRVPNGLVCVPWEPNEAVMCKLLHCHPSRLDYNRKHKARLAWSDLLNLALPPALKDGSGGKV